MPGQTSHQRTSSHTAPPNNIAYDFASSNSTSSHFLGALQRPWMTGSGVSAGGGGTTTTRRASGQTVNSPTTTHSLPTPRVPTEREVNITSSSDSRNDSFTTSVRAESVQNGSPATVSATRTPYLTESAVDINQPEPSQFLQDISNTRHRPPSKTANSDPIAYTRTASISTQPPETGSQVRSTPANQLPVQTVSQLNWGMWQAADNLRFSAGLAPSSVASMASTAQTQPTTVPPPTISIPNTTQSQPMVSQAPPLVSPVALQVSGVASRKRPSENQTEGRRTRSKSDGPTVRQIPTPVTTPTLPPKPYLVAFDQSVVRLRQQQTVNSIEESRLALLREACDSGDVLYLCIHQIYCIASVHHALPALGFGHRELAGFRALENVLMHNNTISGGILWFFTNFPNQPQSLLDAANARTFASVRAFISALGSQWDVLREYCKRRGFPPSTLELIFAFSITSPVMQKTLYVSVHRQVSGNGNVDFGAKATALFVEDQSQFAQLGLRGPLNQDAVKQNGQQFGQKYTQLQASFMAVNGQRVSQQRASTIQSPVDGGDGQLPRQMTMVQAPGFVSPQPLHAPHFRQPSTVTPAAQAMSVQPLGTGPTTMQQLGAQHIATNGSRYTFTSPYAPILAAQQMSHPQSPGQRRPYPSTPAQRAQFNQTDTPLLVPLGQPVAFTTNPNPDRVALHQTHLRSPLPQKLDLAGKIKPDLRLYQYVKDLVLLPQKVDSNTKYDEWHFELSNSTLMQRASDAILSTHISQQTMRLYKPGSILFRLKAVSQDVGTPLQDSDFNVLPTTWPHFCFVSINDSNDIEFRRRQHHSKDLPRDLTWMVRPGDNVIRFSNHSAADEVNKAFYFALELIHVVEHDEISKMPSKLSAKESLASITSALAASQDDEIFFAHPYISIDLVDPFMATTWHTPVRGKYCKHRECFDLQAFLLSRTSKVKDGPTNPDQWLCPICKKDARPQNLVVDEFLVQVRQELKKNGQRHARAILVRQDGSWEAKTEKDIIDDVTVARPKATAPVGNVSWEQQAEGGVDLDGMTALAAYNAATDTKISGSDLVNGSATPTPNGIGALSIQTPIAVTVIEIDDD